MTPAQQTALEGLVGRELSEAEVATIAPLVDARNDAAVAAALSVGRKKWAHTEIGVGTIIEVLGLAAANPVLDALYASPDYRHVRPLLEQGRLRLDVVAQAGMLQPLVTGGLLTQAQLDALVARAKVDDPIPTNAVSEVLNNG